MFRKYREIDMVENPIKTHNRLFCGYYLSTFNIIANINAPLYFVTRKYTPQIAFTQIANSRHSPPQKTIIDLRERHMIRRRQTLGQMAFHPFAAGTRWSIVGRRLLPSFFDIVRGHHRIVLCLDRPFTKNRYYSLRSIFCNQTNTRAMAIKPSSSVANWS